MQAAADRHRIGIDSSNHRRPMPPMGLVSTLIDVAHGVRTSGSSVALSPHPHSRPLGEVVFLEFNKDFRGIAQ